LFRKTGLTFHSAGQSFKGYTLLTPIAADYALLLDMDGRVVHRWRLPGFRVFHARLLPGGTLLDPALGRRLRELELQDTDYEGPTAFVTALLHAAAASGMSAVSLWVATPPYLQAGNPVAALALLEATNKVTRLPVLSEQLREVAETFLRDVEAALEEHPELAEQLKEMLEEEEEDEPEDFDARGRAHWRGPDPDRPPPDAPPGLPSGKALVEAVEKYLKQRQEDDDEPPPTSGPAV
jgi:predicted ATP-grasp superfamily ATP-dependent carboligase